MNTSTTPTDFAEQCNKCGCEYVQVGKVFTVNLDCDCDCHKHPALDFTEQARQLVKACEARTGMDLARDSWPNDLVDRIASALAEAATQGQVAGIEGARQAVWVAASGRIEEGAKKHKDQSYLDAEWGMAIEIEETISALSPIPAYINQVRNKAATAALEQAAQAMCFRCQNKSAYFLAETIDGNWQHRDRGKGVFKCEAAPIRILIAAIGDDKETT